MSDWNPFPKLARVPNDAEALIDRHARLGPKSMLVIVQGSMSDAELAAYNLACRFARLPAGTRFRAIAEGWTRADIVREMN